jgi:hypothetical protein
MGHLVATTADWLLDATLDLSGFTQPRPKAVFGGAIETPLQTAINLYLQS